MEEVEAEVEGEAAEEQHERIHGGTVATKHPECAAVAGCFFSMRSCMQLC